MSAEVVEIPWDADASDTATLLLAAAEELDLDQSVVGTTGGSFVVPAEVARRAGFVPEGEE